MDPGEWSGDGYHAEMSGPVLLKRLLTNITRVLKNSGNVSAISLTPYMRDFGVGQELVPIWSFMNFAILEKQPLFCVAFERFI